MVSLATCLVLPPPLSFTSKSHMLIPLFPSCFPSLYYSLFQGIFIFFLIFCPMLLLFPILPHCSFPFFPLSLSFSPPFSHYLTFPLYLPSLSSPPPVCLELEQRVGWSLNCCSLPDIHRRWHLLSTEPQPSFCIFPLSEHIRRDVTSRKLEALAEAGSHRDHWSQHEALERLVNLASTTGSSNAFCTAGLRLRAFTGTDISKVAQQCYTRVFKQNKCLCSTPLQLCGSLWEGDFPVIEQRWYFTA